jgi:protein-L-isoaspartate(D-aspartate) O-methyltransferase
VSYGQYTPVMADLIQQAFRDIDRALFLPEELRTQARLDAALPIGFGQTNSQPTTVRLMLDWLEPKPGNKVLDVGAGSGWTTALLARIVGPSGKVYAVEKIPELTETGRHNTEQIGVRNAQFFTAGRDIGLPAHAPYDRILVSAAADELPRELIDQLAEGGRMVIPVKHAILEVTKLPNGELDINPHQGFVFVPLIS